MKNAALFHGHSGTPESFWFPYLQRSLKDSDYSVFAPQLPVAQKPDLKNWLPAALGGSYDTNSVLIGHSAGCPLIIALLEELATPVRQTVLVSGFAQILPACPKEMIKDSYDWDKIRRNAGEVFIINSDNDPWGCDVQAGQFMFEKLGGTLILRHGEGHMGSDDFNQPYKEFPLLLRLI